MYVGMRCVYICVMYTRMHMTSQRMYAYDVCVYNTCIQMIYGMMYVNMTCMVHVNMYVIHTRAYGVSMDAYNVCVYDAHVHI